MGDVREVAEVHLIDRRPPLGRADEAAGSAAPEEAQPASIMAAIPPRAVIVVAVRMVRVFLVRMFTVVASFESNGEVVRVVRWCGGQVVRPGVDGGLSRG